MRVRYVLVAAVFLLLSDIAAGIGGTVYGNGSVVGDGAVMHGGEWVGPVERVPEGMRTDAVRVSVSERSDVYVEFSRDQFKEHVKRVRVDARPGNNTYGVPEKEGVWVRVVVSGSGRVSSANVLYEGIPVIPVWVQNLLLFVLMGLVLGLSAVLWWDSAT